MKTYKKKSAVCFGEFFWDVLPTDMKPGGSPFNVACHLKNFEVDSHLISRVGADCEGEKLLELLDFWNIPIHSCPLDHQFKTGIAEVTKGEDFTPKYFIHSPVAWDYITLQEKYVKMVREADVFIFGSLAARNHVSRETLYRLLEVASYKAMDLNLRSPFYSPGVVGYLLQKCNLLKLNKEELDIIISWYYKSQYSVEECIDKILLGFGIKEIIVTDGGNGATYYTNGFSFHCPAPIVRVKDTVGSGDSFLAAFLAMRIQGCDIEGAMIEAASLGSFVATKEEACPNYSLEQLDLFMKSVKAS